MAKADLPTPEELRQLLRYEPETGKLYWRERPVDMFEGLSRPAGCMCRVWNTKWAGREVPGRSQGYVIVTLRGQKLYGHRVAWALHHGRWPENCIDHVNGIRDDNRIENLRDIPRSENQRNMRRSRANTSGVSGVSWFKPIGRWAARIKSNGVYYSLGYFDDIEDARRAVERKRAELGFASGHGSDRPRYPWR